MDQGAQREARISHPAGDDDVGALLERIDNRSEAEVGVGGEDLVANLRERSLGVEVAKLMSLGEQLVESVEDVVSYDEANPDLALETELLRGGDDGLGASPRVHATRVGDDL